MWKISQIKKKGKESFKRNYWKSVIVSLLVILIASAVSGNTWQDAFDSSDEESIIQEYAKEDYGVISEIEIEGLDHKVDFTHNELDLSNDVDMMLFIMIILISILVFLIVFTVVAIIMTIVNAFIINPLEIGVKRFFLKNQNEEAMVREIGFGFDHCYKNIVKVTFKRDIKIILWSLLFFIPGIVKAYEYRMIPYLLAENPDMPADVAFAESKRLMKGNKWHAFMLDLSFIGWVILSIITLFILYVFYVAPYINSTSAALYEEIKRTKNNEYSDIYTSTAEV